VIQNIANLSNAVGFVAEPANDAYVPNPMENKELRELVQAFQKIQDPKVRRSYLTLLQNMSEKDSSESA
jgi:hypothetical protein